MQALDGARTVAQVARQLLWLHRTSRPLHTERFVGEQVSRNPRRKTQLARAWVLKP